jgi:hypothetical protein
MDEMVTCEPALSQGRALIVVDYFLNIEREAHVEEFIACGNKRVVTVAWSKGQIRQIREQLGG